MCEFFKVIKYKKILLLISFIFLSSCSSKKTEYYSLSIADKNYSSYNISTKGTIAIGPISISQVLKSKDIVLQCKNKVQISEFHQWDEKLDSNIESALINNLNNYYFNRKSKIMSVPYRFRKFTNNDYTVAINIQKLQNKIIKKNRLKSILSVQWSILNNKNKVIASFSSKYIDYIDANLSNKNTTYLAIAEVMSKNIAKFSNDIAKHT